MMAVLVDLAVAVLALAGLLVVGGVIGGALITDDLWNHWIEGASDE